MRWRDLIWLALALGLLIIVGLSLGRRSVTVDDRTLPPVDDCPYELPSVGSPAWIADDAGRELLPVSGDLPAPALQVDGERSGGSRAGASPAPTDGGG